MMPRLMVRSVAAAVVVMVVLAACDGGASPAPAHAGTVEDILAPNAFVNATPAVKGGDLRERDTVTTDGAGSAVFTLDTKIDSCTMNTASGVGIRPEPSILLRYVSGVTWCSTKANPGSSKSLAAQVEITMTDPLFGVTIDADTVVVQVQSGVVQVRSLAQGVDATGVLVGPRQQTRVEPDRPPSIPEAFDVAQLPDPLRSRVAELVAALPPPAFAQPDPASSPTIGQILESGRLGIALDEESIADQTSPTFVNAIMSLQAETWGIKVDLTMLPLQRALEELRAGQVQLVVTPQAVDEVSSIPLFEDQQTQLWSLLYLPQDEAFGQAERDFVGTAVTSGVYGDHYQEVFGSVPSYEALRSLVGP